MLFDHIIATFMPHNSVLALSLRIFNRIAAPIFCFLIAEGFHHTSNKKKYLARLILFALISHLPYNLLFGYRFFQATSIIWGLAMGFIALWAVKTEQLHWLLKLVIVGLTLFLSVTANWNFVSVFWIIGFGLFQGNIHKQVLALVVVGVIFHFIPMYYRFGPSHPGIPHFYQLGILLAVPFLYMYNGRLGLKNKLITWFFYIFYPGHMIVLYLLKTYVFN